MTIPAGTYYPSMLLCHPPTLSPGKRGFLYIVLNPYFSGSLSFIKIDMDSESLMYTANFEDSSVFDPLPFVIQSFIIHKDKVRAFGRSDGTYETDLEIVGMERTLQFSASEHNRRECFTGPTKHYDYVGHGFPPKAADYFQMVGSGDVYEVFCYSNDTLRPELKR